MSEGELKNYGRPHTLLYDETSVLYELTKKLSSVEKQVIHKIVNQNIEKFEKKQLDMNYEYEDFKSQTTTITNTSSDEDTDKLLIPKDKEKSGEKKSIMRSTVSYGATNN